MLTSNGLTRRRLIAAMAIMPGAFALRATAGVFGQGAAASSTTNQATLGSVPPDPQVISDLVSGNHILVRKGIIQVQGHLSVRHDRNPNRYFLSRAIAPDLVTTADIMEFDLDSSAIDPRKGNPYQERFIHGEIYKARPDVMAVVHAHTLSILPFATSDIPLRPVYQQATFIVDSVAVFKNGDNGDLISNGTQGAALAKTLGQRAAVLLHGHGEVVVGASIPQVVGRCVELDVNARVLHDILAMGGKPVYLRPAADAATAPDVNQRAWDAWMREENSSKR